MSLFKYFKAGFKGYLENMNDLQYICFDCLERDRNFPDYKT